jgi:choline monooxygenase
VTIDERVGAMPDAERFLGTAITASGLDADGPTRIPVERYTSPAFAALEQERMWPHAWVIACTVDHVAAAGDYFELKLGRLSVVIVRGSDGALRGFQNVCRHRGNMLCHGSGSGLEELRCGYHRWTWDLEGRLREVPSRKGFGLLRNDDFPLFPVRVESWGRLVFVNLDVDAVPLAEYLEGVPADIDWADLDAFRCTYMTTTPVRCNWKVVTEGFSETYHIQGLHRDLLGSMDDINSGQKLWERHGVSYQPYGVPSPRLGRSVTDQVVWDSFIVTQGGRMGPAFADPSAEHPVPQIPDGETLQDVIAEHIRVHQRTNRGVDLSRFDTDGILMLSQYNLFPNSTLLISGDLFTVLSGRPGATPDESELVMIHFERAASADAPRAQPFTVEVPFDQAKFGFVLDQDLGILESMQTGLQQPGMTEIVLSREECRIINLHKNLEAALGLERGATIDTPA